MIFRNLQQLMLFGNKMPSQEVLIPFFSDSIVKKLNEMRKNSILTDVVLVCGETRFDAHRSHLSAASEYLYNMFNTGLKEANQVVEFPSTDPNSFEIILDVLYTGKLVPVSYEKLSGVIKIAHMMQLQEIYCYYRNLFLTELDGENFMVYWDLGEKLEDDIILHSVYGIAENVYLSPDFLKIDINRLTKLLHHLSTMEMCLDLSLSIIMQWISNLNENSLETFDKLIELIDFDRVPNNVLGKVVESSLVMQSELFKCKYIEVTSKRLKFIDNFLKVSNTLATIYLFGQNSEATCVVQKFHKGEWGKDVVLEDLKPEDSTFAVYKSIFCALVKESRGSKTEACLKTFDRYGNRQLSKNLGNVPSKTKLTAAEYKDLFVATAFGDFFTENFYYNENKVEIYRTNSDLKIVKVQWLPCNEILFVLTQEVSADGFSTLNFWRFYSIGYKYKLSKIDSVRLQHSNTGWFAYFLEPSHIAVRFFPGDIILYNIFQQEFRVKTKNTVLTDAVSLDVYSGKVWCLRRDGCLLIQDSAEVEGDWRVVIKHPSPLQKYLQLKICKCNN